MSRSVYGSVEVRNKKTGLWELLKVKFYTGNDESIADFYLGASSLAAAVTGEDDFDYGDGEEDEYTPSKKQRGLDEIEAWFQKRVSSNTMKLREDFSPELREILAPTKDDPYSFTPTNVTFTYADLQLLKRIAKNTSKRAKNFYKYNFGKIDNILTFVYRNYDDMSFMDTGDQIRMTVYVF